MAVIDENNQIPNGLIAVKMRKSMENKNILVSKGALYVGTGDSETVDGDIIYKTMALIPSDDGNRLVCDSNEDEGLRWALPSETVTATLTAAGWEGSSKSWTQTIAVAKVTANSVNYIQPQDGEANYTNFAKAKLADGGQGVGEITLKSYATSKPSNDINIKIIIES